MATKTFISATAHGYTAELDTTTVVTIYDPEHHIVGTGRWQHGQIDLCDAELGWPGDERGSAAAAEHSEQTYEELDSLLEEEES